MKLSSAVFGIVALVAVSACSGDGSPSALEEGLAPSAEEGADTEMGATEDDLAGKCGPWLDGRITSFNDTRTASGSTDYKNMAAVSEKYWSAYRGKTVQVKWSNSKTITFRIQDYCADKDKSCRDNVKGVDLIVDVHTQAAKAKLGINNAHKNLFETRQVRLCK